MLAASTIVCGLLYTGELVFSAFGYVLAIAVFVMLSNALCWKLCEVLTILEGHYTWTDYRQHLTIKYYLFKIISLAVIFVSRLVVHLKKDWVLQNITIYGIISKDTSSALAQACTLEIDSEQFLILILVELTATRATAIIGPWFYYKLWAKCNEAGPFSDHGRPDFDVAVEYLQVLYRQFLLYLGMTIFPWIVLIGMIGNLIDYPINKWYLLTITRTPPLLRGSMRSFLVFFMFLTSLISVLIFPQGIGWVLSGWIYGTVCPGTIYGGFNTTQSYSNTTSHP